MIVNKRALLETITVIGGFTSLGLLVALGYFDAAIVMAAVECIIVTALFRPRRLLGWIPAIVITASWIILSGNIYSGYNTFRLKLFGIAAFPVIAWSTTLAFAYAYLVPLFRQRYWPRRWLRLCAVYAVGIIAVEWFGYNLLGIHLEAGKAYNGWPVLNIFHCPWWMQVAYFVNGFAFMGCAAWMDRRDYRILPAGRLAASPSYKRGPAEGSSAG